MAHTVVDGMDGCVCVGGGGANQQFWNYDSDNPGQRKLCDKSVPSRNNFMARRVVEGMGE